MLSNRPASGLLNGQTSSTPSSSVRHKHGSKNHVQFNLGPGGSKRASGTNLHRSASTNLTSATPKQLRSRTLLLPSTGSGNGNPAKVVTVDDAKNLQSTSTPLEKRPKSKLLTSLGNPLSRPSNGREDFLTASLTRLMPKSKLRAQALTRRNQSKVSYTYQAIIRPSSPSYMASTSASRNRSVKTTDQNKNRTGSSKSASITPAILRGSGTTKTSSRIGSASSNSSNSSSTIRASNSSRTLSTKSRTSRKKGRKSKYRMSVSHHDFAHRSATVSVVLKEKFLMKIFSNLSWNELLAIRSTCKKWYEIISTEAPLKKDGVIVLRRNLEGMALFNKSLYVWTQFRILVSVVFDFIDSMQQEFWAKHGTTMSYLEIRNSSMTLSALVEILSRCPNLEYFLVTWTAEMYSFNSEMIKKYYGIHFRNGTFVKLHELTIDKSYFLTDNALWSLLKWCGGSIHKLALTCGPEDHEDTLSKLKPRWSIEPIQNYTSRFGYSGNFKLLDFSGSNLNAEDLKTLARTEKLNSLIGIRLSSCKINDEAIGIFIEKKGPNLEELYLDNTAITEKPFEGSTKLPRLRSLNISGKKSNFHSLEFLTYLRSLENFYSADTNWLTYNTLSRPLEALGPKNHIKKLDISSSNNIISRVDQRMSKVWFNHLTNIVPRLTELNLNYCASFGNDDNFKAICTNIPSMEKLCVRDWTGLTDEGLVGMTFDDIVKQYDDVKGFWRTPDAPLKISPVVCNLKYLKYLDVGGCKKLTDISVQFAIIHLPRLTKLGLERTQITDASFSLLVTKSPRLEKLSLQGCEHVAPKGNYAARSNGRLVFLGKI